MNTKRIKTKLLPFTMRDCERRLMRAFFSCSKAGDLNFSLYPVFLFDDPHFGLPHIDRYYVRMRWLELVCGVRHRQRPDDTSATFMLRYATDIACVPSAVMWGDDGIVAFHIIYNMEPEMFAMREYLNGCNNIARGANNLFLLEKDIYHKSEDLIVMGLNCIKREDEKSELVEIGESTYLVSA